MATKRPRPNADWACCRARTSTRCDRRNTSTASTAAPTSMGSSSCARKRSMPHGAANTAAAQWTPAAIKPATMPRSGRGIRSTVRLNVAGTPTPRTGAAKAPPPQPSQRYRHLGHPDQPATKIIQSQLHERDVVVVPRRHHSDEEGVAEYRRPFGPPDVSHEFHRGAHDRRRGEGASADSPRPERPAASDVAVPSRSRAARRFREMPGPWSRIGAFEPERRCVRLLRQSAQFQHRRPRPEPDRQLCPSPIGPSRHWSHSGSGGGLATRVEGPSWDCLRPLLLASSCRGLICGPSRVGDTGRSTITFDRRPQRPTRR
jgi:hypothetical protein